MEGADDKELLLGRGTRRRAQVGRVGWGLGARRTIRVRELEKHIESVREERERSRRLGVILRSWTMDYGHTLGGAAKSLLGLRRRRDLKRAARARAGQEDRDLIKVVRRAPHAYGRGVTSASG